MFFPYTILCENLLCTPLRPTPTLNPKTRGNAYIKSNQKPVPSAFRSHTPPKSTQAFILFMHPDLIFYTPHKKSTRTIFYSIRGSYVCVRQSFRGRLFHPKNKRVPTRHPRRVIISWGARLIKAGILPTYWHFSLWGMISGPDNGTSRRSSCTEIRQVDSGVCPVGCLSAGWNRISFGYHMVISVFISSYIL